MADSVAAPVRLIATPAVAPSTTQLRDGSTISVLPPRAQVRVQLPRRAIGAIDAIRVRDVTLPMQPGSCVGADPTALWLAPDGWLLVSETLDGETLARDARSALPAGVGAAVDLSDALVTLALDGPATVDLLARSTTLDLSEATLAAGRCTRTRLAQLAVILRARDSGRVELIVDRGPARWLYEWLVDAGTLL